MSITRLRSRKEPATNRLDPFDIAVVIAAHGDRGEGERNCALLAHTDAIRKNRAYRLVASGVLKGDPPIEEAWHAACQSGARHVIVYPLFMSDGYFVRNVLPERIGGAGDDTPYSVATPLGLDPNLVPLMRDRSLAAARHAGIEPCESRLLVVGHGSKFGRASAMATERMASALAVGDDFLLVTTAFLEEPPFFQNEIWAKDRATVIAGFFSGSGLHADEDIPAAMSRARVKTAYTGAIGEDRRVPEIILPALIEVELKLL